MQPLPPSALAAPCDPATLAFDTTAQLASQEALVGQDLAVRALELGLSLRAEGYHLFVVGAPRTGKRSTLRRLVTARAAHEPIPPDLSYVYNFDDPDRPIALELPPGSSRVIRDELERLVDDYARRLPLAFEAEAFSRRDAAITERAAHGRDELLAAVEDRVRAAGFRLQVGDGPLDIVVAGPDGSVLSEDAFAALPAARRADIDQRGRALRDELEPSMVRLRELERTEVAEREQLVAETARAIARTVCAETRARIPEATRPGLARHLAAIERDLVINAASFLIAEDAEDAEDAEGDEPPSLRGARHRAEHAALRARYLLHVVVDRTGELGAPVVEEANPTYANLFGRIERKAHLGALETTVAGLKAGALQRARGGYLLLDAAALVADAATWAALKRTLRSGEVRIEEPVDDRMMVGSLQPAASPLDAKLLLVGTPELYLALFEADDALVELFKVKVEFDDTLERTPATELALARVVATAARECGAPPLRAEAVARLIDQAVRAAQHQRRLSAQLGHLRDLVAEAGHHARAAGHAATTAADIARAIDDRADRERLIERTLHRLTDEGVVLVRTTGVATGAANGLSVVTVGGHAFGLPLRVTARARAGRRGVLDIEREVGLGGDFHAKGVLLLGGYLAGRYARDQPLAIRATLAAEQSHGPIEGDSAALAELCALVSAIGEVPLRQDLAITGAVSQLGEILAVGDVTTKIEGFFALCARRALTGTQGVIVPRAVVHTLALRTEVIDAVRAGAFAIYAVDHVDQALALMTGLDAGERGPAGRFPDASVNAMVEATLERWARTAAVAPLAP